MVIQIENLSALPVFQQDVIASIVATGRITRYLNSEDIQLNLSDEDEDVVKFEDASISWPSETPTPGAFSLKAFNLTIPGNAITIVTGSSGSGKTLLVRCPMLRSEGIG